MARPTKYTPEREKRILAALEAGCSRRLAAQCGGVDQDTLVGWMRRYSGFSDAVTRAECQAERAAVEAIHDAAEAGDWRASVWWLERRRPESWGRTRPTLLMLLDVVGVLATTEGWTAAEVALAKRCAELLIRAWRT
jgi:hypothetical protein